MVEIPQSVAAKFGRGSGTVSTYLETLINDHARQGWEFLRMDSFTIIENAGCGCLGLLFMLLQMPTAREFQIHVVTFRYGNPAPTVQVAESPT
ncbi:MAG TPA: hypothetical protein VHE55_09970 [Fimbriimonadaceae bacterium]|nr:hypothetical protein [Fimbriimonadaceae bacterium]